MVPRSPPCTFFCTCILRTAIDFAVRRPAAHRANFSAAFSARAICKAQLILRSCGCGREVAKLECVECPAYHLAAHSANFLATAFCESAIDFAEAAEGGGVAGFAPKL